MFVVIMSLFAIVWIGFLAEMAIVAYYIRMAKAEQAESAVQRVRVLAEELASRAPADDWSDSMAETVAADMGRVFLAALDRPADPPAKENP